MIRAAAREPERGNWQSGYVMPTNAGMSSGAHRILLVEDEEAHAQIIQRSFERYGISFELTVASSLGEAFHVMETCSAFDLVITDWRLPDGEGFDLLKDKPRFALLVMTSHGNEHIAVEAMRAGALDYIVKSETTLLDMPRIAEGAMRLWTNMIAKELAQEKLLLAEEALRARMRSNDILLESERRLRLLADAMPQIVWTACRDGHADYFNRQWYEFAGSRPGETSGPTWAQTLHPDDAQLSEGCWDAAVKSGDPYEVQSRLWDRRGGSYRWYLVRSLPQLDETGAIVKWVGTATDIDDHKRLSQELEQRVEERTSELRLSLAEKNTLLKEVHHRVKNNLQVVCSLLSMQIACLNDLSTSPLHDAHSRVLAMSLIHEQIYLSDTLADLDFGVYVEQLANRLFSTYCVDPSRIRLELSVEDIQLTVDDAIPCGLILNELVSNSLKHAFGDGREGIIRISLSKVERSAAGNTNEGYAELEVGDNGIGLPAGFQLQESASLGLQVVSTLIHQLRADLVVSGDAGTRFAFSWKLPETRSPPRPVKVLENRGAVLLPNRRSF
jgi:PAS domain S-box-containing protein